MIVSIQKKGYSTDDWRIGGKHDRFDTEEGLFN